MTCYEYLETIFLLHRMSLLVVVIDLGDFVSSQEGCDYFFFFNFISINQLGGKVL